MDEKTRMIDAIFEARQAWAENPAGTFDKRGRWGPTEEESCKCCSAIRGPSIAYPYTLLVHCRTRKHVKNLVEKRYEQTKMEERG